MGCSHLPRTEDPPLRSHLSVARKDERITEQQGTSLGRRARYIIANAIPRKKIVKLLPFAQLYQLIRSERAREH